MKASHVISLGKLEAPLPVYRAMGQGYNLS